MILEFIKIAKEAGFTPLDDGKLNLPANDECALALGAAAKRLALGGKTEWVPGDEIPGSVTLTGPGPVWGYLAIAHSLHGLVPELVYEAPNGKIRIYGHGV